jgi:hypothetical protein
MLPNLQLPNLQLPDLQLLNQICSIKAAQPTAAQAPIFHYRHLKYLHQYNA